MQVYPLPHDRGDVNTALARATALSAAGAKRVKVGKLIPAYGKVTKVRGENDLKAIARSLERHSTTGKRVN